MPTIDYKNTIKCAVFDLDGTLLNTLKTINYYLNFALKKSGLGEVSQEDTCSFVGDGARKLITRALGRVGAGEEYFDTVYEDYNKAYNSDPYYLTEPYDGISEALDILKSRGIKLAVLSNKPDFATKSAVQHFFGDRFSIALGGCDHIPLKPAPDSLLSILSKLCVSTDEVIYIGDYEPDILTAKNAEIELSVSVSWGFRTREQLISAGAKLLINRPDELINLADQMN